MKVKELLELNSNYYEGSNLKRYFYLLREESILEKEMNLKKAKRYSYFLNDIYPSRFLKRE